MTITAEIATCKISTRRYIFLRDVKELVLRLRFSSKEIDRVNHKELPKDIINTFGFRKEFISLELVDVNTEEEYPVSILKDKIFSIQLNRDGSITEYLSTITSGNEDKIIHKFIRDILIKYEKFVREKILSDMIKKYKNG